MKAIGITGAAVLLLFAAPAAAMPVSTFLAKAEGLKKKGPLAVFSGDLKLLTNTIKSDAAALRAERLVAQKAGRGPAYCPTAGAKLSDKDILTAMEAVPGDQRNTTDSRTALRAYMVRRFPCPA